jgi:hypothetical protein
MSWEINLPVRDRADRLAEVAIDSHQLADPEERVTVRELVLQATLAGDRTAGDLLDRLEAAGPAGRRPILDDAREAAGLERTEDIDARERHEEARHLAIRPPAECVVCGAPSTDANGMPAPPPSPARKWHCPEHVAQAQPGDMDPPPVPIGLDMQLHDPDEIARELRRDALLAQAEQERRAERAGDAQRLAELRRAEEARFEQGLPPGYR